MLLKYSFSFFGRSVSFLLRAIKEKTVLHYGVGNRCADGTFCLFIDYDDTPLEWVKEEISLLQHTFVHQLGTAYLFETKHGVHVVFLEKQSLGTIITMLDMTTCDKHYKSVPMLYGRKIWVLRQSEKKGEQIRYLGRMRAYCEWKRSEAHSLYMKQFCNVPVADLADGGAFDDLKDVKMGYYHVAERNN